MCKKHEKNQQDLDFVSQCEKRLKELFIEADETNACLLDYEHEKDETNHKGTIYENSATRVRDFALQVKVSNNILQKFMENELLGNPDANKIISNNITTKFSHTMGKVKSQKK